MSIYTRKIGNATYTIFQTSENKQLSLGPVGEEDPVQVEKALKYVRERRRASVTHYDELESTLLNLLPAEERRRLPTEKEILIKSVSPDRYPSAMHSLYDNLRELLVAQEVIPVKSGRIRFTKEELAKIQELRELIKEKMDKTNE